jgi:hypothetical protein
MENMEARNKDHDKIAARWLDAALKQYGEAEPRTGLEVRVLASLQAEREHLGRRRSWWPTLAGITAIVLLGITVAIVKNGVVKDDQRVKREAFIERGDTASVRSLDSVRPATPGMRSAVRRKLTTRVKEAAEPRLEQFPAPQPLSRQEEILASYVVQFQREAAIVAQAQTELLERDLAELDKMPTPSKQEPVLEKTSTQ